MRFKKDTLEKKYKISINKIANKYIVNNQKDKPFKTLLEIDDYYTRKNEYDLTPNKVISNHLGQFSKVIVNGKVITNDNQFLDSIYTLINWLLVKPYHNTLSINCSDKLLLLNPNLFANRQKAKIQEYQYQTRNGDQGNARKGIVRNEANVINENDVKSIFTYTSTYNDKTDLIDKTNLICLYRKETKQKIEIPETKDHRLIIEKSNQSIAFSTSKSSYYYSKNLKWNIELKLGKVYLWVNDVMLHDPIGSYKILSVPSIEYNYNTNGIVKNDKNSNITLGKIKRLLNENKLETLWEYLINSQYVISYKKELNSQGKVEKLTIVFDRGKVYFTEKRLDKTYLNIYYYPNYLDTLEKDLILPIQNIKSKLLSINSTVEGLQLDIDNCEFEIEETQYILEDIKQSKEYRSLYSKDMILNKKLLEINSCSWLLNNSLIPQDKGYIERLKMLNYQIKNSYNNRYFLTKNIELYTLKLQTYSILSVFCQYFEGYIDYLTELVPLLEYAKYKVNESMDKLTNKEDRLIKYYTDKLGKLKITLNSLSIEQNKYQVLLDSFNSLNQHDLKVICDKLTQSAMNKDSNQRLCKLLGAQSNGTLKVFNTNKRIETKTQTGRVKRVSQKSIEKLLKVFISELDNFNIKHEDKSYGFKYFKEVINRDNPLQPFKEKVYIPKAKIDPKIRDNFEYFMVTLCLNHFCPNRSLPMIYPNKINMKHWLKVNNNYLNEYGIEIVELIP